MTSVYLFGVVGLALLGAPIFACMAALAAIGAQSVWGAQMDSSGAFANVLQRVLDLAQGNGASTLATIPLFIFAGYIMAEAKTAQRMVGFANALVGWIPGGLALVTIVACALFTTFTGASGVTIVAIGALILPSLLKAGYQERFSLGLVTGTGSVGLLFPPALPLIVYGIVYGMSAQAAADSGQSQSIELIDFSIERFLLAGIVPGLVLVGVLGIYAVYVAIRDKVPRTKFDGMAAIRSAVVALPELLIPVLILGTLATGKLQIPEAAAVTALYVLFVEVVLYRDIKPSALGKVARNSLGLVGAIFIIMVAATALTHYFIVAGVPEKLYAWTRQYIHSKWTFLLALNVLLLVVGCLMDIFSAILVVVPLIVPAAKEFQIDPYHLGVIFLLNLEIGYLTPPVGLNLFITSFRFRKPMAEVYRAAFPFIGLMLIALALVTYIPELTPIKATRKADPQAAAAPTEPAEDQGNAMAKSITWPDGGVWVPERCDTPEIKDDPLAHAECTALFKLWARCATLPSALDKVECEQKALDGEDPFEADAGAGADEGGGAEPEAPAP